jgi:hypothetical protein
VAAGFVHWQTNYFVLKNACVGRSASRLGWS